MEAVPVKWRGVLSGLLQEGYALGFLLLRALIVCFSALGLATSVFCRRPARAAYPFYSCEGNRDRSLEAIAHGLANLSPRNF